MVLLITSLVLVIIFLLMVIFQIHLIWFFVPLLTASTGYFALCTLVYRITAVGMVDFIKKNVSEEAINELAQDNRVLKKIIDKAADKVMG